MWKFLSQAEWTYDQVIMLTDETDATKVYRDNIIAHLEWLVKDCQPGDLLLLHYSGHGYQRPTRSPTEDDGFDETIVPADCPYPPPRPGSDEDCPVGCKCPKEDKHCWRPTYSTMIRDNELRSILVDKLPEKARLVAIFDCCHSGSIVDLEYRYLPPTPHRKRTKLRKPRLSVTEGTQHKRSSSALALVVQGGMMAAGPVISGIRSEREDTVGIHPRDDIDYHNGESCDSPIEVPDLRRPPSTGKSLQEVLWEHREAFKLNELSHPRGQVITISAASDPKEIFELPKAGLLTDSLMTVVKKHNYNVTWCKLIDEMTLLFAVRNQQRKDEAYDYPVHPVLSTNKSTMVSLMPITVDCWVRS
ncbi:Ca(2+)-dependent cysteine protease [Serendipita sp. 397]|nr:Ca(2+)-dependent cysteine protease [Serendipita sp. 397]